MVVIRNVSRISRIVRSLKRKGKTVGLVPTMGALHDGHISLVNRARLQNDIVVVSVFVNPIQFGPREDLKKYPRDFKRDERLLRSAGVDIIFYPSVATMYPSGFSTYVEETAVSMPLCGRTRAGHFRGVTTVVAKLFNIVQADTAYFGQKDYQQVQVIKRMVRDLDIPVKIRMCPTVREKSGLAMSSRNEYLTRTEREQAAAIYAALKTARRLIIEQGVRSSAVIRQRIIEELKPMKADHKIEYVDVRDAIHLTEVRSIGRHVVIALAVRIGKTRLIDNIVVIRVPHRRT